MAIEWEQYRERYIAERPETYDAYVDVWLNVPESQQRFTGWATFSQCANAEPAKQRDVPQLVSGAEALMRLGGYEIGPSTSRGGRRWRRTHRRASRPASSQAENPPTAQANSRPNATKPRPRAVECPNDPGMMVPIAGECICGWSPSKKT